MARMPLPPLRGSLKISPQKHQGKEVFVVQDQEHLIEHVLMLPPLAFVVASFLDGRREATDIQAEIETHLKAKIPAEEIENVVRELDHHLLLESSRANARRTEIAAEFSNLPSRPAQFVQGPATEVSALLDGFFSGEAGAGKIGDRRDEQLPGILAP